MQCNDNSSTASNTAKPFLKWVGGKGKLLTTIDMLLPSKFTESDGITYVEPFIGGGSVMFFMLQKYGNIKKAVINDLNADLILAYKTVRDMPEKLINRLSEIQKEYIGIPEECKRKEFYLAVRKRFNSRGLSDVDNTAYLIFMNKTCFNGLYRVNSKGEFNVPFGRYENPTICDAETIYADSKILQRVEILNCDFEETEKYASTDTFVYIDPPYRPLDATSNFNSYTKEAFGDSEQIRLKKFVDRLSKKGSMVMLSNSDGRGRNPQDTFFDDLYADYSVKRVYASRSVNAKADKRGKLTELLIRNYEDTVQCVQLQQEKTITYLDIDYPERLSYQKSV